MQIYFSEIYFLYKREIKDFEVFAESRDNLFERIKVLNKIYKSEVDVLITTIDALTQTMPQMSEIYGNILKIKKGDEVDTSKLAKTLVQLGYKREQIVEGMSSFSIRGDIIDISYDDKKAIRIELFGDFVEEIRYFNIFNQRSIESIDYVEIYPNTEYVTNKEVYEIKNNINQLIKELEEKSDKNKNIKSILKDVKDDLLEIIEDNFTSYIEKYYTRVYPNYTTLLSYISDDFNIYFQDLDSIKKRLNGIIKENNLSNTELLEKGKYSVESLEYQQNFPIFSNLLNKQNKYKIYFKNNIIDNKLSIIKKEEKRNIKQANDIFSFNITQKTYFKNTIDILFKDLKNAVDKGYNIILVGNNPMEILGLLEDRGFRANISEKIDFKALYLEKEDIKKIAKKTKENQESNIFIFKGNQKTGFVDKDLKIFNISFSEILSNKKENKRKLENQTYKTAERVIYSDLEEGDLVVHRIYGIGRFIGIEVKEILGLKKAYIKIEYAGDAKLYVPTDAMDNVKKYIASDGIAPRLSRLGTKDWENLKARVKNKLREVAEDLIALYAKRSQAKGFAFSEDSVWQKQLEDSFEYDETTDQLRCIKEIKEDMQKSIPMDRLLCGDVRFWENRSCNKSCF